MLIRIWDINKIPTGYLYQDKYVSIREDNSLGIRGRDGRTKWAQQALGPQRSEVMVNIFCLKVIVTENDHVEMQKNLKGRKKNH